MCYKLSYFFSSNGTDVPYREYCLEKMVVTDVIKKDPDDSNSDVLYECYCKANNTKEILSANILVEEKKEKKKIDKHSVIEIDIEKSTTNFNLDKIRDPDSTATIKQDEGNDLELLICHWCFWQNGVIRYYAKKTQRYVKDFTYSVAVIADFDAVNQNLYFHRALTNGLLDDEECVIETMSLQDLKTHFEFELIVTDIDEGLFLFLFCDDVLIWHDVNSIGRSALYEASITAIDYSDPKDICYGIAWRYPGTKRNGKKKFNGPRTSPIKQQQKKRGLDTDGIAYVHKKQVIADNYYNRKMFADKINLEKTTGQKVVRRGILLKRSMMKLYERQMKCTFFNQTGRNLMPRINAFKNNLACDVVVVGSGISGLSCAWALKQCGMNVIVLEAQEYIGGRLLSYTFPEKSLRKHGEMIHMPESSVEMGGAFLSGSPGDNRFWNWLHKHKAKINDIWGGYNQAWWNTQSFVNENPKIINQMKLVIEEVFFLAKLYIPCEIDNFHNECDIEYSKIVDYIWQNYQWVGHYDVNIDGKVNDSAKEQIVGIGTTNVDGIDNAGYNNQSINYLDAINEQTFFLTKIDLENSGQLFHQLRDKYNMLAAGWVGETGILSSQDCLSVSYLNLQYLVDLVEVVGFHKKVVSAFQNWLNNNIAFYEKHCVTLTDMKTSNAQSSTDQKSTKKCFYSCLPQLEEILHYPLEKLQYLLYLNQEACNRILKSLDYIKNENVLSYFMYKLSLKYKNSAEGKKKQKKEIDNFEIASIKYCMKFYEPEIETFKKKCKMIRRIMSDKTPKSEKRTDSPYNTVILSSNILEKIKQRKNSKKIHDHQEKDHTGSFAHSEVSEQLQEIKTEENGTTSLKDNDNNKEKDEFKYKDIAKDNATDNDDIPNEVKDIGNGLREVVWDQSLFDKDLIFNKNLQFDGYRRHGDGYVVTGYSQILDAFLPEVQNNVYIHHFVTDINATENEGYPMQVQGINLRDSRKFVINCKYVCVTVSVGVLKANIITFQPKFPEKKIKALNRLRMGLESKMFIRFSHVFWPSDLPYFQSSKYHDFRFVNYAFGEFALNNDKGGILGVMIPPQTCQRWNSYGCDKIVEIITLRKICWLLSNLFDQSFQDVINWCVDYKLSHWHSNLFTRGSYSYLPAGCVMHHASILRKPYGRIHFAGEGTSEKEFQCVDGAHETGFNAAREILQRYYLNE
ncbi:hypothetical protein RFI_23448 [Reticulomyxa filosa]|uniref:Amine oxidase domain-containing protein n=1 Tax=Reticulomyxa filosa TaxID=46433 RepID=X6MLJ2_RETFI|nr:hypothetical protein RFI_23448 [Reticulomyxa filosa]|eukprot:ETO13920.1 hypothetical protein RFI_23448 [Reticulomyxa filosa]